MIRTCFGYKIIRFPWGPMWRWRLNLRRMLTKRSRVSIMSFHFMNFVKSSQVIQERNSWRSSSKASRENPTRSLRMTLRPRSTRCSWGMSWKMVLRRLRNRELRQEAISYIAFCCARGLLWLLCLICFCDACWQESWRARKPIKKP